MVVLYMLEEKKVLKVQHHIKDKVIQNQMNFNLVFKVVINLVIELKDIEKNIQWDIQKVKL